MTAAAANAAIVRRSAGFLALFVPFVLVAFWPSYFSRIASETQWRVHVHGAAMSAWFALAISQAALVRAGRRDLHRRLGRASYALVPLIALSSLSLAHYRLREALPDPPAFLLYFFYLQLVLPALFVTAWGLGIANRRDPPTHARYMLCTVLTSIDPIFGRVIGMSTGIDFPVAQLATFGLTDALLVALIAFERRHATGSRVFAGMLALFVFAQVPTFFVSTTPAWRSFAIWYAGLPSI